jgi:RNA polymerase sigma factor (sigma-70 family)
MATGAVSEVLGRLRAALLLRDGAELTDGQLLECFVRGRDGAAVAALVHRHGPMVWGVCRRVLGHHDAEDAFQATFLVLARKAASVVPREMVANWLYGVAHRTALKARAAAVKRKGRERPMEELPEPAVADDDLWRDLQPLLDRELSALPDKYRAVVVLCELEGKTRREVARLLGVPEGTVAGRLARARALLAKRLARHGLQASGAALAGALSVGVASAGVPDSVVASTIKFTDLLATGRAAGAIPVSAAALAEGVLKSMLLTKLRAATAVLAVVAAAGVGVGGLLYETRAAEPPAAGQTAGPDGRAPAKQRVEDPVKKELRRLRGTWVGVSYERQYNPPTEKELGKMKGTRLVIDGDRVTLKPAKAADSDKKSAELTFKFTIDPTKEPKTIDWLVVLPDGKSSTLRGIYKLDQDPLVELKDTLTLCFGAKRRPAEFKPKPDPELEEQMFVFKRDAVLWDGASRTAPILWDADGPDF